MMLIRCRARPEVVKFIKEKLDKAVPSEHSSELYSALRTIVDVYYEDSRVIRVLLIAMKKGINTLSFNYSMVVRTIACKCLEEKTPESLLVLKQTILKVRKDKYDDLAHEVFVDAMIRLLQDPDTTLDAVKDMAAIPHDTATMSHILFDALFYGDGQNLNMEVIRYCFTLAWFDDDEDNALDKCNMSTLVSKFCRKKERNLELVLLLLEHGAARKAMTRRVRKMFSAGTRLNTLILGLNDQQSTMYKAFNGSLGERQLLKTIVNMSGL